MIRRRWATLLIIGPYLLVLAIGFVSFRSYEHEQDQRVQAAQHESHQRCVDRQADRDVLRQIVTLSTQGSAATLDLTRVDGFDELDPATQFYFRALSNALAAGNPVTRQALRDQLLAQLPPIDC